MLKTRLVFAMFTALLATTADAERWYILWSGTFDAAGAVDLDSIVGVPAYPGTRALWVYTHRGLDTFSCSPPSNCLATSQLTYYYVDCGRAQAAVLRRIPMNLRGKVVETIDEPVLSWFSFALPYWQYYVNDEYDELWRAARERQEQILRIHRELPLLCSRLDAGALTLH